MSKTTSPSTGTQDIQVIYKKKNNTAINTCIFDIFVNGLKIIFLKSKSKLIRLSILLAIFFCILFCNSFLVKDNSIFFENEFLFVDTCQALLATMLQHHGCTQFILQLLNDVGILYEILTELFSTSFSNN